MADLSQAPIVPILVGDSVHEAAALCFNNLVTAPETATADSFAKRSVVGLGYGIRSFKASKA